MLGISLPLVGGLLITGTLKLRGADPGEPMPAPVDQPPVVEQAPAAVAPAPVHVPNLCGEWCGSWLSYCTGHKGPIRATFCRLDNCRYEVRFRGRFCKLIPFCYSATLRVTGYKDGRVYLAGSKPLPLFGTFTFSAWATDRQFVAGYSAEDDRGQFVMTRQ